MLIASCPLVIGPSLREPRGFPALKSACSLPFMPLESAATSPRTWLAHFRSVSSDATLHLHARGLGGLLVVVLMVVVVVLMLAVMVMMMVVADFVALKTL